MVSFRNEWIKPVVVVVVLLQIEVTSTAKNKKEVIFKCCENGTGVANASITLSKDYFIRGSNAEDVDIDGNDSSEWIIKDCQQVESTLFRSLSIYPNSSDAGFLKNGFLQNGKESYSSSQYCVRRVTNGGVIVQVAPINSACDGNRACLRKCCGPQEVYDLSTYGVSRLRCVPSEGRPWVPVFHSTKSETFGGLQTIQTVYDHPRNWCFDGNVVLWSLRTIGQDRKSLFRILNNGSIVMKDSVYWKSLNSSRICIDGAINIPGYFDPNQRQTLFSGDPLDTIILECGPTLAEPSQAPLVLYGIALTVSTMFLLATIIIYGLVCKINKSQNLHALTLLGYVTTQFFFYVSLMITFFYLHQYPDPGFTTEKEIFSSLCGIIAVTSHFLYISSTCWLTVISFDIFSKFRILKLTRARSKNKLKFFVYLIFTLLVPLTIVGVGVVLDATYGDNLDVNIVLPHYGWNKCFLDLRHWAGLYYLFGPIGILLCLNCVLYVCTIVSMYKLQESTKFANANNTQVQKQRAKIRLFSKLFLLMGVSWIFEFASYLIFGVEANIVVIIGDMINILQPILIFIICVCKRNILQSLCQKYTTVAKFFSTFEPDELNASTASSSSRGPMLSRLLNPISTTQWFRSRINSTMTDTSNISNQSIKSMGNGAEEVPTPFPAPTEDRAV